MTSESWIAALFALFVWWFSTGAILLAVRKAQSPVARLALTLGTAPLLALAVFAVHRASAVDDLAGVYFGFLGAIALWGWIELAFLTGIVTGPNLHVCPKDRPGWERFLRAWGTIAYHEMALVAALIVLGLHAQSAANSVAFWTFAVLFFARLSAKLNLFLGVPKINVEFLPAQLAHLPSHFRIAPMNALFPISVTGLSFAVACWLERLFSAGSPAEAAGFSLLAALTALALLEHWFMVLPLPDEKLWRWALPAPKTATEPREDAHGL
ncbi:putative photosynthetic complex assembly protein PuhE [Roseivivax sp. THAF30]|uniref:putative photosynthetic complex assembly protein PuhE n=1 Tax=Roseivivax sp. THAF30 TaxID=2587852 RepID=UPI0012688340|nr:putative photosynthetic complex assembly protein PuhE [Roseivivax sp. THAF30]QFT64988.1 hypothetical protein FIU91_18770 [Roseivivax sp. THAF30]